MKDRSILRDGIIGNVGADQKSARELKDGREDDGAKNADRLRTHGICHGIGDIIGADIPGHVEANHNGPDEQDFHLIEEFPP